MGTNNQKYSELKFSNAFMFSKVMKNHKLCKQLLEVILGVKIRRIVYQEEEKTLDHAVDSKSVRLDVYIEDDENTVYDVEMQTTNPGNLPKRSRYYQAMIDLNLLQKGENYSKLKKSYVIFILKNDIFKKGRHIYTFENICLQDKELHLNDETTKVFLNPVSDMDDVDEELSNFLSYVASGEPVDVFTQELEQEVENARTNKKWENEYMGWMLEIHDAYDEGIEQGRTEGIEQGRIEGIERGRIEGIEQGRELGGLEMLIGFVQDGTITMEQAAARISMTVEEFERRIESINKEK